MSILISFEFIDNNNTPVDKFISISSLKDRMVNNTFFLDKSNKQFGVDNK